MKKSIVLATAVAAVLTSGVAAADLSANAGVFSNYIWRGVSQTGDAAAGQGGIDWGNDSGLYAGIWTSTIAGGQEVDVYAGFAGEAGSIGYDVGAITYQYPVSPNINFTEVYVSGSINIVTIGLAYTVDAASANDAEKDPRGASVGTFESGDLYLSASADFAAGNSDISVYAGSYMFDQDGKNNLATGGINVGDIDYKHFGASISKDGFTFAVDKNDIEATNGALGGLTADADAVRFTVSYSKDFEL